MKRHPLFYRLPAIPAILSATSGREKAVEYNEWGAMTKDEARGITSITYDRLGNPSRVDFSSPNGSYASYVYSATGERLKATHYTKLQSLGEIEAANYLTDVADNIDNIDPPTPEIPDPIGPGDLQIAGMTKLEYHGPVIYRDGYVDMVRFPGGYATIIDGTVTFHYYTQDYLGNNRAVVNGSTGEIEQTVAYYPYGAVIADLGISSSYQPFKFGGKELTTQNGLNEYDFGARQYYPAVPHFTSVDPLCEKYYSLSPYLYCGNNPVNFIDSNGMEFTEDSYKYVNMLLSNIDKRQSEIIQKIAKKESELANGNLSKRQINKLMKSISKMQSSFDALGQVKTEISVLENSSQVYNIVRDNSLNVSGDIYGNGAETRSGAVYNTGTDMFDILLGDDSLGLLAHELKHAYQFETGDLSSSNKLNGMPFYDQTDEREAYDRGNMFGQSKMVSLPKMYNKFQKEASGIRLLPSIIQNNPSVLQSIANRNKAVFRWRGVTYKYKSQ